LEILIFKEEEKIAEPREKPSVQGRKATYDTKPQSDDWRKASAYPTMALQPTYTLKFEFENFQSDYCH